MKELRVLKSELMLALPNMDRNKAVRSDGTVKCCQFGINETAEIITELHDGRKLLEYVSR